MTEGWQADPYLGQTFEGRYSIELAIGRGGMGAIYRATDTQLARTVAIKLVQKRHTKQEEIVRRFQREMRATTSIEHPNTIRVYEFGITDNEELYLVMEYLRGETLDRVVFREGPLPVERIVRIARQVSSALVAAHEQGIVHRDLKPENIMLVNQPGTPDFVKVFDFGLARYTDDRHDKAKLTLGDHRVGTPLCMAPEYITKGRVGRRTDLYALGVVMYTMATGSPPFKGTPYEILHKHVKEAPVRPSVHRPGLPEWLEAVILQLLEKRPSARQADATQVIAQLDSQASDYAVPELPAEPSAEGPEDAPPASDPNGTTDVRVASQHPAADAEDEDEITLPIVPRPAQTIPPAPRRGTLCRDVALAVALFTAFGLVAMVVTNQPAIQRPIAEQAMPMIAVERLVPVPDDTELRIVASTISRQISDSLLDQPRIAVVSSDGGAAAARVEGTVRRHGDDVRVHVTLIETATSRSLWSHVYELPLDDEAISIAGEDVADQIQNQLNSR